MSAEISNVVITGGSGLVGKALTDMLIKAGYGVRWLVRNPQSKSIPAEVKAFRWSPSEGYCDPAVWTNTHTLIHLAGENVGAGRWTADRKKKILDSRVEGTQVLKQALDQHGAGVQTVIAASATGYYGNQPAGTLLSEDAPQGDDFLSHVTAAWEAETAKLGLGRRLVQLRIGVVLSPSGGALEKMAAPVRLVMGAPLGSGEQMMSWIHIHDLCRMILFGMEHVEMAGMYNAVAPQAVSNRLFTRALAKALHKPLWLPPVPAFVLRLILGEMSAIVLDGASVDPSRILSAGFRFEYDALDRALEDLLAAKS